MLEYTGTELVDTDALATLEEVAGTDEYTGGPGALVVAGEAVLDSASD